MALLLLPAMVCQRVTVWDWLTSLRQTCATMFSSSGVSRMTFAPELSGMRYHCSGCIQQRCALVQIPVLAARSFLRGTGLTGELGQALRWLTVAVLQQTC